jgi:hypothetical protein
VRKLNSPTRRSLLPATRSIPIDRRGICIRTILSIRAWSPGERWEQAHGGVRSVPPIVNASFREKAEREPCGSLCLRMESRASQEKARRSGLSSSLHGFGRFCRTRARTMTWLTAYRALRRALVTYATAEKFAEFSIYFLALGDQLLNSRDLAVYFHVHHLLSGFVHTQWRVGRQLISAARMLRYVPP